MPGVDNDCDGPGATHHFACKCREDFFRSLLKEIDQLKRIPDCVTSISEGKRVVHMLKSDREKSKKLIHDLRLALVKSRGYLAMSLQYAVELKARFAPSTTNSMVDEWIKLVQRELGENAGSKTNETET